MYFGMRAPRMTRPNNTTAYTNGDLVANNATAGSVVPLVFGEALAGGCGACCKRTRLTRPRPTRPST